MPYLIGTDEAGYGPNLGPLTIAATAWQIPRITTNGDDVEPADLYQQLDELVCGDAPRGFVNRHEKPSIDRLPIADSKRLYRPGGDLSLLELGVLVALSTFGDAPQSFRGLLQRVCPQALPELDRIPWYQDVDLPIPVTQVGHLVAGLSERWQKTLGRHTIQLHSMQAAIVYPETFNRGVAQFDSKGAVLSNATLDLAAKLVHDLPNDETITIVCDKHGGRNKYGGLLQDRFEKGLVRVVSEGRSLSRYEVGNGNRSIQVSFQVGGESFLPSALASMLAKYLRELCMMAFNDFWQREVKGLKPTAGYPVDAKRFRHEIQTKQQQLGIRDEQLWRSR